VQVFFSPVELCELVVDQRQVRRIDAGHDRSSRDHLSP
jgi:hypothetical protein